VLIKYTLFFKKCIDTVLKNEAFPALLGQKKALIPVCGKNQGVNTKRRNSSP
jgi:hypothetical protein